uniref:50S ribosomal protein L12, chloroplastic,related n=1 Tax=Neospora caninum (strain Liverpool) TaxID=572307 RepID=A0A0F7UJV3_NEOCL|nr:TPA: 50S ribosomal protein L12, chloroplastic,related [Neospora caninum Liverpool]
MERTETHYEVLGLSPEATLSDIKKAFRHLVKVYHPDKKSSGAKADQERYLQIQHAFETLSDTRAREDYDSSLRRHTENRKAGPNSNDADLDQRPAAVEQRFVTSFYKTERLEATSEFTKRSPPDSSLGQAYSHASETKATLFRDASEPETTDLFRRLDRGGGAVSHSEGFEQWLRSRPASALYVVNDDTILNSQGRALRPKEDELHRHQCTWPVSAIVADGLAPSHHRRHSDVVYNGHADHQIPASGGHEEQFRKRLEASVQEIESRERFPIRATRMKLKDDLDWGEVLVRVLHAPVLPYDLVMIREGYDVLGATAQTEDERRDNWPFQKASVTNDDPSAKSNGSTHEVVLGCSWLAEVVDVGPGVKVVKRGDYVIPLGAGLGCWRAASVCAERDLMIVSKDLFPRTEETAVAKELFLAYYLLQEYTRSLRPGDAVLVNGAGCLVGQMIVQFCRLLGLRCICIVRDSSSSQNRFESRQTQKKVSGPEVSQYLRSLGADEVFSPGVNVANVLTKKRQSLPLVSFELSGGSLGGLTAASWIARGGKVILVHAAGMIPQTNDHSAIPWNELLSRSIHLESFYLNGWLQSARNQQKMRSALESVGALVRAGKLVVDLAEPIDFTAELGTDGVSAALLALNEDNSGSCFRQPMISFASLETERLLFEEEQQKTLLREQQARQAQESLFAQSTRNASIDSTRHASEDKASERPNFSVAVTTDGEGLSFLELAPEQTFIGNRSGEMDPAPLCIFAHARGEVPEELRILLRHYRQHFKESFRGSHFVFPTGPFMCPVDGDDLPCWATTRLSDLLARESPGTRVPFGQRNRSQAASRLGGTQSGANGVLRAVTPEEIEVLKDLETSCDLLADLIEEKVRTKKADENAGNSSTENVSQKQRPVVLAGSGEGALVFPVEAVVCLGAPLLAERVLQFLVSRADNHAKQVKIFFLFGSKDKECPAWSQEEWRRAFEDRGYCVTRETILDGTHETDDRTLAHVAAVFSILRLE